MLLQANRQALAEHVFVDIVPTTELKDDDDVEHLHTHWYFDDEVSLTQYL